MPLSFALRPGTPGDLPFLEEMIYEPETNKPFFSMYCKKGVKHSTLTDIQNALVLGFFPQIVGWTEYLQLWF